MLPSLEHAQRKRQCWALSQKHFMVPTCLYKAHIVFVILQPGPNPAHTWRCGPPSCRFKVGAPLHLPWLLPSRCLLLPKSQGCSLGRALRGGHVPTPAGHRSADTTRKTLTAFKGPLRCAQSKKCPLPEALQQRQTLYEPPTSCQQCKAQ